MSFLHSEAMTFLVVRRTTTQVVIERQEEAYWGQWRGVLWATVSWRWGIDLSQVRDEDIRRQGGATVIRLPDPQLLDFAVQPGTMGFMSRSTVLPKLLDMTRGGAQRQALETLLQAQAMAFAERERLLPGRAEILQQVNGAAVLLEQAAGIRIRFE